MSGFHSLRAVIGLLLMSGGAVAMAAEPPQSAVKLDIPGQLLMDALNELARQSGLQVVIDFEDGNRFTTKRVVGTLTPSAALDSLLAGTELKYEYLNERTVAVKSPVLKSRGSAQSPGASNGPREASLRVAQTAPGQVTDSPWARRMATEYDPGAPHVEVLEEIVITGSNIRGAAPAGSQLITIDRQAIERTGYSTVEQLLQSLPQNYTGGGASEDGAVGGSSGAVSNAPSATGINLRGLGNSSTLVLVNGRRLAPSVGGAIVDVSMFPLSAVERIEVLPDGSSAIYGSDAVAGVVNIILARDYSGAESRIRYGELSHSGADERLVSQSFGGQWDGGNALLTAQYRSRDRLTTAERSFSASGPRPTDLLPDTIQRSATFSARHEFASPVDVFADALYSNKTYDRNNSLSTVNTAIIAGSAENANVNAGVGYALFSDWRLELTGGYGRDEVAFSNLNVPRNPALSRTLLTGTQTFDLRSGELKGDGTLFSLPGGNVRMALGVAYRTEDFVQDTLLPAGRVLQEIDRDVKAAFAELSVPIVSERNRMAFARSLSLSASGRYDRYSDFGNTTNPRVGIEWSPAESLSLHSACSTSFRAPTAAEQLSTLTSQTVIAFNFAAADGVTTVPGVVLGGSEQLVAEESESFTLGFTFAPPSIRGLKLGANYFHTDYTDRIQVPPFNANALQSPGIYGPLITLLADDAAARAFVAAQVANGAVVITRPGVAVAANGSGARLIYSVRQRNLATLTQTGFDVNGEYRFSLGGGELATRLGVAVINEIETAIASGSSKTDLVDTFANPVGLRGRADIGWSRGKWLLNAAVNYTDHYTDTAPIIDAPVSSWTTVDLTVRYSPSGGEWLKGLTMVLAAQNVFDRDPPHALGSGALTFGYDAENADPSGRILSFELRKQW